MTGKYNMLLSLNAKQMNWIMTQAQKDLERAGIGRLNKQRPIRELIDEAMKKEGE